MDALRTSRVGSVPVVGASAPYATRMRSFRLLKKNRCRDAWNASSITAEVRPVVNEEPLTRFIGPPCANESKQSPCAPPIGGDIRLSYGSTKVRHPFPTALTRDHPDPSPGFESQSSIRGTSKPHIWNTSYRNRLSKVGSDYGDRAFAAAQGAFGGCNAQDSVSRRAFLKSVLQVRLNERKNKEQAELGGGDGGNGKGIGGSGGGSGNDGFSFGDLSGDDGFFIAGTASWVVIGAAFCLFTSLFAQIFRGNGSPSSRNKKGSRSHTRAVNGGSSEVDSLKARVEYQGGSLSHASSRNSLRGYNPVSNEPPNQEPSNSRLRRTGLWCKSLDANKLHFRGLFTGTLYPPPQVHAGAFYRQSVGLVGPEPGDWVELVVPEGEDHDESLEEVVRCSSRNLAVVLPSAEKEPIPEPQESPEELSYLMEQLQHVKHLLKKSEQRRAEALHDLQESNKSNETKEHNLRAKIKSQEAMNKKIRTRLSQIHEERDSLVHILEQAKGTIAGVLPGMEEATGQVDDLSSAVKAQKTDLRLMEKQLSMTARERDAVLRRMDSLQRDVNDIENLLDIVEKSRDLVSQEESADYTEKIQKANTCIQVLQRYLLQPTGSRQLSPIREVGNRVVIVFEQLMVELKRGFMQASKYIKQLEGLQSKLSQNSQDETILASQLTELKAQYERLAEEKANIEQTLETMKETLAEAQENLDGTSRQETELRGAMETLTCEKDTLSAMMRSIQREVADIESLTQIMEKTRGLILEIEAKEMGLEHVALLENCLNVLQQHHLKPSEPYDHVSRNISDRLVHVFENLLTQTKQSIIRAVESKGALKRVEDDLEGALSEESTLSVTIEGLRSQLNDMTAAKCSLSNDVQMLKNELDEKTQSLDQLNMELTSLDDVRGEQEKDIELLRAELDDKRRLLDDSKQAEEDMTNALHKISEERDVLQSRLFVNEEQLCESKTSLEELLAERRKSQDQLDALQAEKSNLETQLTGLSHRIKEFESENSRLNAVAQTLRSNLDHERREKELLEQEAEDLTAARTELHEKYLNEVELLKDRLENAQGDCKKLEETCVSLEEQKSRLEKTLEEESNKYNEQMEQLIKQHIGDPVAAGTANSNPEQPTYEASPFETHDIGEPSGEAPAVEEAEENQENPNGETEILPPEEEGDYANPGESKVLTWLDKAEVDPLGVMPAERDTSATAPLYEQDSGQLFGNLMPTAGPICDRKIQRRLSWPQDMTFALNDNLLGAAQELVEMTTATLELAAEKNQLEAELNEVRQAINEARAQLEERETEVSDLTEHFLQVYQIASDLAADNEEQSSELRELRLTYKRQQQDIETRDRRLALLEAEFAMANMAPPRSAVMTTNHFAESLSDFPQTTIAEPATSSSFGHTDFEDGNGRLRSISSLGLQSGNIKGLGSPRFEAPGTPSMISTTYDNVPPRAHSSATMMSVATKNYDEADRPSVHYSFSDTSSLSAPDEDCSDMGYPDADHCPMRVDAMI